ncbi:MAG: AAA family ATPase [Actinomycetota bacterium]|nr:AAA family ATPase [Actinomycetota bacterium]
MERKLATVVFVDLVGSTALVARSDPEIVRRRLARYFEHVSDCVTGHGGIVEKFAGDAVMAAFGIPQAHEDDAERAVRAAFGILDAVRKLDLEARIGIEAGEVVTEDADSTFATGEPVNVAARLQQAAEPNQILIGPGAQRLALGRLELEDVGPIDFRGGTEPVWTWAVTGLATGHARAARFAAPFVGREAELELLENTFARAVRDRRAHLFTIYGDPGIGKTRLAEEFLDALDGATVLRGRSLPYGESITYWSLAEMVKVAAGIADDDPLDDALEKLRQCCPAEAVADLLALATGVLEAVQGEASQQEIAWAARAWAEKLTEPQPLVLLFEDIHWAEEPLLELIEHLAAWVKDAPLLILTLARPELLDVRPDWGGGRVRATAIELEPLAPSESEQLVDALLETSADASLEAEARRALLEKTEGNPLFVEETIRMFIEEGGDGAARRIPDTLQALIGARIDRLEPEAKRIVQRASVVGRVFWAGAVEHLSGDVDAVGAVLEELELRDFIAREPRSTISDEEAYRFKHVLIREVAYGGLAKSARAGLHERFADWLRERAGEELLEIRAYHLDQAVTLLAELDGAAPARLVRDASAALAKAGKRALAREANRSARRLLQRSVELQPTLERRYEAARAAWRLSDIPAVSVEMEAVCEAAREAGDAALEARALTAVAEVVLYRDGNVERGRQLGERALSLLHDEDDEARYDALETLSMIGWWTGDLAAVERYTQEMIDVAERTGRKDLVSQALIGLVGVHDSRLEQDRIEPLLNRAVELAEESGSIMARAWACRAQGDLALRLHDLEGAQTAFESARELFTEAGAAAPLAKTLQQLASVAARRAEPARAEKLLRESVRTLRQLERRGALVESLRQLAELLVADGKLDEAERFAIEARETVTPHDISSLATTSTALALVREAQGRDEEAERLFREALAILGEVAWPSLERKPLRALARFLRSRGREDEARAYEERLEQLELLAAGAA